MGKSGIGMLDTPLETDADLELGPDDVGGLNWSFMFRSPTGTKPFTSSHVRATCLFTKLQCTQVEVPGHVKHFKALRITPTTATAPSATTPTSAKVLLASTSNSNSAGKPNMLYNELHTHLYALVDKQNHLKAACMRSILCEYNIYLYVAHLSEDPQTGQAFCPLQ